MPGLGQPSQLPTTAPTAQKIGEKFGQVRGAQMEAETKLPSRAIGAVGTGYNILQNLASGVTGQQFPTIPKEYLDVMQRGELFNVPNAVNFYKNLLQKYRGR